MASYIATGGNFNTGATWHLVDANSLLDSEAANTEVDSAAFSESIAFTVAATDYDGFAVKLADAGTGAYTLTGHIYETGVGEVAGTAVTINRADLCSATTGVYTNEGGWVFFEFASPVALAAATNYSVGLQESNAAANIKFYSSATTNWSRMLRTTTDAAAPPAAGSILHIMEEKTGAGAATAVTVTMDAIAGSITKYGSGTDNAVALTISDGGTLDYGITAATAYYLQLDGNLIVYNGGTLTIGKTGGNEVPRNSTAVLEFDPTADGGMGLTIRNGGTFTAQGLSRTIGKNVVSCLLNTDEAVNQTELGVNTDTGWLDNDAIGVASTTRTYSQCETGLLNGDAAAAALTVDGFGGAGGGLVYDHSGTTPTQAEVILLTRNVKVRSTSATVMSYVHIKTSAIVDIDWVEFYYLGESATYKRGVDIEGGTVALSIQYSSFHDFEDYGVYYQNTPANITFSNNVFYNCSSLTAGTFYLANGGPATDVTISNNIIMRSAASSAEGFWLGQVQGVITNNTACGMNGDGFYFRSQNSVVGTFSGNTAHSCAGSGIYFYYGIKNSTISSFTAWRNSGYGLNFAFGNCRDATFSSAVLFGNTTSNIYFTVPQSDLIFESLVSNGDSSFATLTGINDTGNILVKDIFLYNCDFSTASGIKVVHSNSDINIGNGTSANYILSNCKLGSTNEIGNNAGLVSGNKTVDYVHSTKHDQTTGVNLIHESWFKYGKIITDLTVYNTAAPSMKCTPNSATAYTLESGSFKVNVNSGQTVTPHVFVRQSEAAGGDSANYNGSKPRLVLKRNDAIGVTADAVIDTATGAIGNPWEELTAAMASPASEDGVAEFVIQCDGTTGFINVDDFSATVA